MKSFLVIFGAVLLTACDAPWAGPSLPAGSHTLNPVQVSLQGPFGLGPDIVAATTLSAMRDLVLAHGRDHGSGLPSCQAEPNWPDPCWTQQPDLRGRVYIAVVINYECTSATKEATALAGHTLYFIHWIGKPGGVCNASMAEPNWRLYAASRSDLPSSGTLTVRLELQGDQQQDIDSQVALS